MNYSIRKKKLEELSPGDKIRIQYGSNIFDAEVLENFKNHEKIYLKIDSGCCCKFNEVFRYKAYNFWLLDD